jgi:hypothetical protein
MGKEKDSTRLLIKGELEGWGPERGMRKERNYPLRLQSWNLSRRREEVDPPLKAGTTANQHRWSQSCVRVPNGGPAELGKAFNLLTRGGGKAALVPQASEELRRGEQAATLKGDMATNNIRGDAFETGIKSIPILLYTIRGQDEIVPKHPERHRRIVDAQPEGSNPLRSRRGP